MSLFRNLLIDKKRRKYYCEVEYLEASGTQYINTGMLSTASSKVDIVYGFTSMESGAANNCAIFGGRNNSTTNTFTLFKIASQTPQYFRFDYNSQPVVGTSTEMTWNTSSKYRFQYNGTSCITTNTTTGESVTTTREPGSTFTTSPITLFAVNTSNQAGQFMSGRIYKYWYTDGTNTVDLIPVLDWNMTPCMYDRVTDQLFYNAGTGSFSVGRQIHSVEYLESTGTQYILTGFTPTVDTDFELELSSTKTSTNWAMGCPTWVGVHYKGADGQIGVTNSSTSDFQQYVNYARDNTRITMKLQGNTVYANGVSLGTITRRAGTLDFALFGYRDANRGATLLFSGSIYKCTIWDNDILVRDFIPMVDELGVGAMFDRVSHTIYDNAGTGAFGYSGREVEYLQSDGARAIIAGVTVDDTCGYDIKWMALNADDRIIMGTKGSGDSRWVLSGSNNPNVNISWNTSSGSVGLGLNKIQTAQMNYFNDRKRILNDTPLTDITTTLSSAASTYSVCIFGGYWGSATISLYSTCRIYYAKITKGTEIIRDFIPMVKDGSPCLFDKIGGLYYFGTGTGSFITGKIVEPEYE